MKHTVPTRNILIGLLVTAIVFTGGLLLGGNLIITIIAALAGGIIILTAKHLGSPLEKTSTKS